MDPNRYAVPLEQLDGVRVEQSEQISAQAESQQPGSTQWAGLSLHPFGDGMGTDADSE